MQTPTLLEATNKIAKFKFLLISTDSKVVNLIHAKLDERKYAYKSEKSFLLPEKSRIVHVCKIVEQPIGVLRTGSCLISCYYSVSEAFCFSHHIFYAN